VAHIWAGATVDSEIRVATYTWRSTIGGPLAAGTFGCEVGCMLNEVSILFNFEIIIIDK
jgi:hypothetical protein